MGATASAIDLLKAHHDVVRDLLEKLVGTTERGIKKREQLLKTIEEEVRIHTQLEEEIFYPALKRRVRRKM